MRTIKFYNTLSKSKEQFVPLLDKIVKLYACGVTPYDHSHIGHGRSFVHVDLFVRFLRFLGYEVTYVRNVTDIDDKLIAKAEKVGDIMKYKSIADEFTKLYQEEMHELNCIDPDFEPRVTDHVDKIIVFIRGLIDAGKAYVVDSDVYFDVSSFADYGKLSGKNLEDLQAGARVEVNVEKKNPADFALWKGNDDQLFWKSPWGYGRPGWHIECSVLAKEFLGETIDIHCGGADLIFPHHENERAQSEGLHGKVFSRFWVHNALLNIDRQKMSKSLGNILSLKEIFTKYDPMILRYYFLQHQYRTPIDFNFSMLDSAQIAYKKLIKIFNEVPCDEKVVSLEECEKYPVLEKMIAALCDDLNTPKALGILFENLSDIKLDKVLLCVVKRFLQQVLGLNLSSFEDIVELTPEIQKLIEKREAARNEKNWARADEIRDELKTLGFEVQDKKV